MRECGVCLTASFEGYNEFCDVQMHKARKAYECCECSREIQVGEMYERAVGKYDGEMWTAKTCAQCAEIADAFYCDGRMYGGGLWEEMDNVWDSFNTVCLDKLTTAAAKAFVVKRWNEWKFR